MLIETHYGGLEIHREDKIIYAKFVRPHMVLSTCRAAGGFQDGLSHVYNHQGCEPTGHSHRFSSSAWRDPKTFRQGVCERYGLPPDGCATMGTAANMNNAFFAKETFRDLEVIAVCTGGVETNAGRAGDPASYYETAENYEMVKEDEEKPGPGTINTMIFIGKPLTPGAMARTIMTATEAKTAALQELAVSSRYSDGPATGTGTDQIVVACLQSDDIPLTGAGKHSKLGELIGKSVLAAVKGTLAIQNDLTPRRQCSAKIHLERFGLTRGSMKDKICEHLDQEQAELLRNNFTELERDPVTVAAAAALAHLKDKFAWGVLPPSSWSEVMAAHAAQLACAVSGDYERLAHYRESLAPQKAQNDNAAFVGLACRAFATGFAEKWK